MAGQIGHLSRKKFTSKDFNRKLDENLDLAGEKGVPLESILADADDDIANADAQIDNARDNIDYEALAKADAQQPEKSKFGKFLDFATTPLSGDLFQRTAKGVADKIDDPNKEGFFKTTGKGDLQDWLGWGEATLRGAHRGAIEGTGAALDSFTSPADLAAMATGFGAVGAASKGFKTGANALRRATQIASIPIATQGAKGVYETGKKINEKGFENFDPWDLKDLGLSALQTAAGAAGMHFPASTLTSRFPQAANAAPSVGPVQGPKQLIKKTAGSTPVVPEATIAPDPAARLSELSAKIDSKTASQADLQEASALMKAGTTIPETAPQIKPEFTPQQKQTTGDSGARLDALYEKIDTNQASQAEIQEAADLLDAQIDAKGAPAINEAGTPLADVVGEKQSFVDDLKFADEKPAPKQRASKSKGGFRVKPENMSGPQLAAKVMDLIKGDKGEIDYSKFFQGEEDLGYNSRTNDPDTVSLGELPTGEIDLNQAAIDSGSDLAKSVMPSRQRPGFNQRALGTSLDETVGKVQLPPEFAQMGDEAFDQIPSSGMARRVPREGLPAEFARDMRQFDDSIDQFGRESTSPRFEERGTPAFDRSRLNELIDTDIAGKLTGEQLIEAQALNKKVFPERSRPKPITPARTPSMADKIRNFMREDSGEFDMDFMKKQADPNDPSQPKRSEFAYDWDDFHEDGMSERQYTAFGGDSHKSSLGARDLDARGYPRPETEPEFGPNVKQYPRAETKPSFGQRFKESMTDEQGSVPRAPLDPSKWAAEGKALDKKLNETFSVPEGVEGEGARETLRNMAGKIKKNIGNEDYAALPDDEWRTKFADIRTKSVAEDLRNVANSREKRAYDIPEQETHNIRVASELRKLADEADSLQAMPEKISFLERLKATFSNEQGSVPRKDATAAHYQARIDELDAKGAPDTAYRDALSTSGKDALKKGETWRDKLTRLADYLDRNNPESPYNLTKSEVPDSIQTEAKAPDLTAPVDLAKLKFVGENKGKSSIKTPLESKPEPAAKSAPAKPAPEGSARQSENAEALFGRGDLDGLTKELVVMGRRSAKDAEYQRLLPENLRFQLAEGETWRKRVSTLVKASREGQAPKVPLGVDNASGFDPDAFSAAKNDPQVIEAVETINALETELRKSQGVDPQRTQQLTAEIERQQTMIARVVSKIKGFMGDETGEINFDAIMKGKPVYHGTQNVFDNFDVSKRQKHGLFPKMNHFAEDAGLTDLYSMHETQSGMKRRTDQTTEGRPNTIAAKIGAKNVLDLTEPLSPENLAQLKKIFPEELAGLNEKNSNPGYVQSVIQHTNKDIAPFDAIRYLEHDKVNWAVPEGTEIKSTSGKVMSAVKNFMSDESGEIRFDSPERPPKAPAAKQNPSRLLNFGQLKEGVDITARKEPNYPEQSWFGKIKDIPKSTMSVDLPFITSAAFRQTKPLAWTTEWFKAWGKSAKAYGDEAAAQAIMSEIRNSKNFKPQYKPKMNANGEVIGYKEMPSRAETVGVHLSGSKFLPGEEQVRSQLAEKLPWVRASNRAYSTFVNHLRQTKLDELLDQLDATGNGNNLELGKAVGDFVNTATGRGSLKWEGPGGRKLDLERTATVLQNVMWAPRLFAANTKFLNPYTYINADPIIRKQYAVGALRMAGTWAGFAGLAKMAGADVSLDPTSSDFGKIKIGDTRIDPAGGMQQLVVYLARMAPKKLGEMTGTETGSFMSSASGKRKEFSEGAFPIDRASVTEDFVTSKLDPVTRLAYELMRSSSQRPVHLGDKAIQMALPIMAQDIMDAAKEDPSLERLLGSSVLSSGGMGVNTYGKGERFSDPVFTDSIENALGMEKRSLAGTVGKW